MAIQSIGMAFGPFNLKKESADLGAYTVAFEPM
jgi:hypothetical protein